MFQVNYNGLRRRKTYDEWIDYLANDQEIINYPDRRAKQMMGDPYIQNLLHEGTREMEEQQLEEMKQRELEHQIRLASRSSTHGSVSLRTAMSRPRLSTGVMSDIGVQARDVADAADAHEAEQARVSSERRRDAMLRFQQSLSSLQPAASTALGFAHQSAAAAASALGSVGQYAGRNLVENIAATPGVIRDVASGVGQVADVVGQVLEASRATRIPVRGDRDWISQGPAAAADTSLLLGRPVDFTVPISAGSLLAPPSSGSDTMVASSSAAAAAAAPVAKTARGRPKGKAQALPVYRDPRQGGVEMDYEKDKKYWEGKPLQYIREQVTMRGIPLETQPKASRGVPAKTRRLTKKELLAKLFQMFD